MCIRDSRIYRAHQLCNEGYQIYFDGLVTTVWSAPNYCYRCGNKASILELYSKDQFYFNVFEEAPENKLLKENSLNDNSSEDIISNPVVNRKLIADYFEDDSASTDGSADPEMYMFSDVYQARSASNRHVDYFL